MTTSILLPGLAHNIREMDSSDHLVNFAVAVTGRLATIAPGAGGSDDKLFGPALAAALWLVNQYLDDQQVDSTALKPRLLKLLNNLESICKVSKLQPTYS